LTFPEDRAWRRVRCKQKLMSPFYLTSGRQREGGGTRKRLMRTFKLARHRFGQPWLFVSSGNAKGKGALPPPFRRPCIDTPFASVRSLPLPFDMHAYICTNAYIRDLQTVCYVQGIYLRIYENYRVSAKNFSWIFWKISF